MKMKYKWFELKFIIDEDFGNYYDIIKDINTEDEFVLGYIEKKKEKWVFASLDGDIIWYDDCLQDVVNILKELNKK